jgi:hypothetical protein
MCVKVHLKLSGFSMPLPLFGRVCPGGHLKRPLNLTHQGAINAFDAALSLGVLLKRYKYFKNQGENTFASRITRF